MEKFETPKPYLASEKNVRNIIAPAGIEINPESLKIGDKYAKTFFLFTYPRYLSSGWFNPIINLPNLLDASIFIHPVDTVEAMRKLRKKVTQIEAQLMEKQSKGLVRDPMLETAYQDVEALRDQLQKSEERLFNVGVYITVFGDTLKEIDKIQEKIEHIFESQLVYIKPAVFQQLEGFSSVLPLCTDKLEVHTGLNSGPVSSFFPFIATDLTSDEGTLYGANLQNNSLVIFDRFSLENANQVVFAKAGSGKSFASKLDILRSLMMGTDVLVIDPENEYKKLAESVGGSYFKISLNSDNQINPFDIPIVGTDDDPGDVFRSHILNLTGLLRLMLGTISPEEEGIIDRALYETYASRDITPDKKDFTGIQAPLLGDLQVILENMEGGRSLAQRLERFTRGSFSTFVNSQTNIDIKNRLIVFSIRDLEEGLRPIAMYIILNYIWNLIRVQLKKRLLIVDEAWIMMKYPDSAAFLYGLVKRARKYYLGVTTITQDVEDFMNSPYGRPIITNSTIQLLLKQSPATIDMVGKAFNLTDVEKGFLLECGVGEGLFFAGMKHVAIKILASYFEHQIITTNPAEVLENKAAEQKENA